MPHFNAEQLQITARRILEAAGVREQYATTVANELVDANLVGHDSHGVIRLMQYELQIRKGIVDHTAEPRLVLEKPALAVLDGRNQFGQVLAHEALTLARSRVKSQGTFSVFCRHCSHVGRLGSYTARAARLGFLAMMAVNSPGRGRVSPWGGVEPRLPTNPLSVAAPTAQDPIVLDMTSSVVAEGKIRVAHQRGESIPEGWLADGEGQPVTDPGKLYSDPSVTMLPLGGDSGFKGYGMAVAIDILCGVLSGYGVARADVDLGCNGVWFYLLDIESLMDPALYDRWIMDYVQWLTSSQTRPGVKEILLPGQIEQKRRAERERDGIDIPDETWCKIVQLASRLGIELDS